MLTCVAMENNLGAIINLLSCPDDGGPVRYASTELLCSACLRRFSIRGNNLAEMLPLRLSEAAAFANPAYHKGYLQAFEEVYRDEEAGLGWGAEETVPESWSRKRRRQVAAVEPLITEGATASESVCCDIAAGAGNYTLAYAHRFRFVFHCDLSVDNLNYARRKARERGIKNVFFLRADYFALPFQRSLDRILCLDTLIRGESHDAALLGGILRSLAPTGIAVVDFHNWWHNPLRRIGLLPENFVANRSYTEKKLRALLAGGGVSDFDVQPFVQEAEAVGWKARLLKTIIPPARFLVRIPARRGADVG
jgi:SAM-dependent methyltransferase